MIPLLNADKCPRSIGIWLRKTHLILNRTIIVQLAKKVLWMRREYLSDMFIDLDCFPRERMRAATRSKKLSECVIMNVMDAYSQ